jgi:hypothetical protein
VIGLTRSLTTAGAAHGIKINLIAPAAFTRMAGGAKADPMGVAPAERCRPISWPRWSPSSPTRDCPVSGEIYAAGAGRFARIFIASTEGYVHGTPDPTIEDIVELARLGLLHQRCRGAGYYMPPRRPHRPQRRLVVATFMADTCGRGHSLYRSVQ